MTCFEKTPGKFYQLFKMHKKFSEPDLPPARPIISGCGSITENLSLFVDHHTKDLVLKLPTYIKDTPDFLRKLEELKSTVLPPNSVPITLDVVGLYQNIPHQDGLDSLKRALETRAEEVKLFDDKIKTLVKNMHYYTNINLYNIFILYNIVNL